MDRFDLSKDFRDFLARAVELQVWDAASAFCAGARGMSEDEVAEEVLLCAFNGRHSREGGEAHAELCRMNDARVAARGA